RTASIASTCPGWSSSMPSFSFASLSIPARSVTAPPYPPRACHPYEDNVGGLAVLSQMAGAEGTRAPWPKSTAMIEAARTLMKSEPELTELIAEVEGVEVTMAEKGFGTRVELRAAEGSGLVEAD